MENTGVDLLAGIGIALYLGVTFVKWAYQEIVIVLAGFIFRKYLIRTV